MASFQSETLKLYTIYIKLVRQSIEKRMRTLQGQPPKLLVFSLRRVYCRMPGLSTDVYGPTDSLQICLRVSTLDVTSRVQLFAFGAHDLWWEVRNVRATAGGRPAVKFVSAGEGRRSGPAGGSGTHTLANGARLNCSRKWSMKTHGSMPLNTLCDTGMITVTGQGRRGIYRRRRECPGHGHGIHSLWSAGD